MDEKHFFRSFFSQSQVVIHEYLFFAFHKNRIYDRRYVYDIESRELTVYDKYANMIYESEPESQVHEGNVIYHVFGYILNFTPYSVKIMISNMNQDEIFELHMHDESKKYITNKKRNIIEIKYKFTPVNKVQCDVKYIPCNC
jgi:hypothetical protein